MDSTKESAEKVLIAGLILLSLFIILVFLVSNYQPGSFTNSFFAIILALETFNFRGVYGPALLFLSLFMGVFAVYLFEFLVSSLRNEFGGVIYMAQYLRLKNHSIICGGGRIGERVAFALKERGENELIIENNEPRAIELKKFGFKVLRENSLDEKAMKMANIRMAKTVFACLGTDVDNFIVVLNAREMNKNVKIITRCNSLRNINKFKLLGADEVVLPEIVGADRMVYLKEKKKP